MVIRGYKGESSSEVSDRMLRALSSSPTFSSSKLTPAFSHGILKPIGSCWRDVTLNHCQGLVPTENGSQQAINFLLAQNFSATSASCHVGCGLLVRVGYRSSISINVDYGVCVAMLAV